MVREELESGGASDEKRELGKWELLWRSSFSW